MTNTNITIADRYILLEELGAGGMGTVYKGLDTRTNVPVAIKQLKPDLTTPELIERFKREGEALRDLNHPNIVKMLDAVEVEGSHYLVMEYLPGGDLKNLIQQHSRLDHARCVDMAIDLADALTRAHRLNIIHRDLKPANVLIGHDGTVRLSDFGIAYMATKSRVTNSDAIIGTVDYLSPEALNGEHLDSRADIWAFGVMLFEMLTGKRPFAGETLTATITAILTAPPPDLEALVPDVPIALVDLVYRMLERDSDARIASVRYVGAELEDILYGRAYVPPATRFETTDTRNRQSVKHNLPAQTTPFVGREHELAELDRLFKTPSVRFVSIVAQGGMGKTRLALETIERQSPHFEHGVYFVDLAPLGEVESIIPTIAGALNYQFQSDGRDPKQQVLDLLHNRQLMLLLDNYEHLLDGAEVVTAMLHAAPRIKVLVTSRQRLDRPGEILFHLGGMEFPAWETPQDALRYAAVQLFMNSARLVQPNFELTPDNLDDVARICRLVEGMPLGIVLSASWLGMLSPEEIADELQRGLDFLSTDSAQIPERQRSIRAVMDYSWRQMTDVEQNVFMSLSVFRGGFTREAAQEVAGANLRILLSLMTKSLIRRDAGSGRYEIHELLRQYASVHLDASGLTEKTRRNHAAYIASLTEIAEPQLRLAKQEHWYDLLDAELENVRAALEWTITRGEMTLAVRIITAMFDFWLYQGHHLEWRTWLERILPRIEGVEPLLQGKLYSSRGGLAWAVHDLKAARGYDELAVSTFRKIGDQRELGWALTHLAATVGLQEGGYHEALSICDEALKLFEAVDERVGLAYLYNIIGNAHGFVGQVNDAAAAYRQSLDISQANGEVRRVAMMYGNLAETASDQGDYQTAFTLLKDALRLMHRLKFNYLLITLFPSFAKMMTSMGRLEDATTALSIYAVQSEASGYHVQPMDRLWLSAIEETISANLDARRYQLAWDKGQRMSLDEGVEFILDSQLD